MRIEKIPELSVIIHTKNAADTLERTLESLHFAGEIIIIDMHISDETVSLARDYTNKIFQVDDVGYADPARNFGISKATGPWVLVVDADEVVPQSLVQHLPNLMTTKTVCCYYLPRKNIIFEKWIEKTGWWPDYQARLFKKGTVRWEVGVHKQPIMDGEVLYLPAKDEFALVHYNYTSVEHFLEKLNTYTTITAGEHIAESHNKATASVRHTSLQLIKKFKSEFLRRLFAQDGLADHTHGVALSFLQSIYEMTTILKTWQQLGYPKDETTTAQTIQELNTFARELQYWVADWQVKHTTGLEKIVWQLKRKWYS